MLSRTLLALVLAFSAPAGAFAGATGHVSSVDNGTKSVSDGLEMEGYRGVATAKGEFGVGVVGGLRCWAKIQDTSFATVEAFGAKCDVDIRSTLGGVLVPTAVGTWGHVKHRGTGSIGTIFGAVGWAELAESASNTDAMYGLYGQISNPGGGTCTYGSALELEDPTGVCTEVWGMTVRGGVHRVVGEMNLGSLAPPTTDASLDLSATDKAFMPNRLTTVERDALVAVAGMTVYNTDDDQLQFYDGAVWTGGSGSPVSLDLGNDAVYESAGVTSIATNSDTNSVVTEPTANNVLLDFSKAVPLADHSTNADNLTLDPTDCVGTDKATGIDRQGDLTCAADIDTDTDTLVGVTDAAADTTTWVALAATNVDGAISLVRDEGLSYNSNTDNLTTTTFTGALVGNSSTATALAANGGNCSAGQYPLGVDASGAVESCTAEHAAVTLDANADSILSLSTQALGLDTQAANTVFAGRATVGAAQVPTFRALVALDIPSIDHGSGLGGLSDDDHTQYALLAGRAGGQTLIGGTAAGDDLTLQSTANATRGSIIFGTSAYDEVNNRLGIGTASPSTPLHTIGNATLQSGSGFAILAGADVNATTLTDTTRKFLRIGMPHYTNAEEPFLFITGDANSTYNALYLGGGTTAGNAATQINFHVAPTTTTVNGTNYLQLVPGALRPPTAGLTALGTGALPFSDLILNNSFLLVDPSDTFTAGTFNILAKFERILNPASTSAATDYGIWLNLASDAANNQDFSGNRAGIKVFMTHAGGGVMSAMQGQHLVVSSTGSGVVDSIAGQLITALRADSSGTASTGVTAQTIQAGNSSTATVALAMGQQIDLTSTAGIITSAIGTIYGRNGFTDMTGGTLTNAAWIKTQPFLAGPTYTNPPAAIRMEAQTLAGAYQIQQLGTSGMNVLAGNTRVGGVTDPTVPLDLTGSMLVTGGYIDLAEYNTTTDAAAPSDNHGRLYVRDNGAGKEQLVVRFNTGAVQVIATEP